ncbi:hypothetical protein K8T06_08950 [bacterium]|nr:hypothetical protein [bacterium]
MSRNKIVNGKCHICGDYGKLTFEHVPPRKAFNDRPVMLVEYGKMLKQGLEKQHRGIIQQKGAGGYTLCEFCNNRTGAWYGRDFINWSYQALNNYINTKGISDLFLPFHIFPLRVIKQIITMFFSINDVTFSVKNPELVKFVLHRTERNLNPRYQVYCYIIENFRGMRNFGIMAMAKQNNWGWKIHTMSELAFPPFGFLLIIDSDQFDERLLNITHFCYEDYDKWRSVFLRIPVMQIHLPIPGDFRTEAQIRDDRAKNEIFEKQIHQSQ